ncbi:hypothetical protein PSMK_15000 [Phycisphaera mikurensis NBRC 102666]|uniref:Uncharacterized protein n=1 Tax=Phycisphaera mikurensis (strain NBRC 102666 / KCTC 22515 / FYK2301M01) TaxID=1142394 RepID=I0IEH1_PHYMF|nr:hypothetical protein PSMK_15000 [Phycisphaera mikurensis NBRC 102666]
MLIPGLAASALVLGGALLVRLAGHAGVPEAGAAIYNPQENVTLLTAGIDGREEGLFVIDHATSTLLVYSVDRGDDQMVLENGLLLDRLFNNPGAAAREPGGNGDSDDQRPRRPDAPRN